MKFKSLVVCSAALAAGMLIAPAANAEIKSVTLIPYRDTWASAKPRLWDIEDRKFTSFINNNPKFVYNTNQVTVTYDSNPTVPYFVGHIEARGLKPNFWYQMKLIGKPVTGKYGWGAYGDDTANQNIGYAARWWCDSGHSTATNFDDNHYENYYHAPAAGVTPHNIYGYQYMAGFLTDQYGNASLDFNGRYSYHVTWKGTQNGYKDVFAGKWFLSSTSRYGYGTTFRSKRAVSLYYEYELGYTSNVVPRSGANGVRLPAGNYNCRFLLTEESFHNNGTFYPTGGYWQSVLASEDFVYDGLGNPISPDTDTTNDVVFTIQ